MLIIVPATFTLCFTLLGPWAVFGASGALAFQFVTGLALAWILRRGNAVDSQSERVVVGGPRAEALG